MSELVRPIPRSLDDSARILGLSPLELGSTAVFYAVISPILKGVPLAALLSFTTTALLGATLWILNRTHPPHYGLHTILSWLRPRVTAVMPWGLKGE